MSDSRKRLSGFEYRKRRLEKEESVKKCTTPLKKFLSHKIPISEQENSSREESLFEVTQEVTLNTEKVFDRTINQDSTVDQPIKNTLANSSSANQQIILKDIGFWPEFVSDQMRLTLLELGPIQMQNISFPVDKQNRSFSIYYYKKLRNNEKIPREWLIYSESKNAVYCFNCKLFGSKVHSPFSDCNGFNDWKHLSQALERHEKSKEHIKNVLSIINLKKSLKL